MRRTNYSLIHSSQNVNHFYSFWRMIVLTLSKGQVKKLNTMERITMIVTR